MTRKSKRQINSKKYKKLINYLVSLAKHRAHDRDNISLMSEMKQPKNSFKLLETNNCGCSTHETQYCCMRQKVHDKSKSAI
jgi:hypothetical protein